MNPMGDQRAVVGRGAEDHEGDLTMLETFDPKFGPGVWLLNAEGAWDSDFGKVVTKRVYKVRAAEYAVQTTFITGGWSPNEDVIEAMHRNTILWMLCWESSHRGGKFVFEHKEGL